MIVGKKVRLIPTKEQEIIMRKSCGIMRYTYNWALSRQKENYDSGGRFISDSTLRREFTIIRNNPELGWLREVSNDIPKQAIKDLCKAYKSFFQSVSKYPRFKRKNSNMSFYNDTLKLKVHKNIVVLSKIGHVKTSEQLPICEKYYNPRITYDGKYWYISVGIDVESVKLELNGSIGIDLGIKIFAVCSNGMEFKNINKTKKMKNLEKRLKQKQRQASKIYLKKRSCKSRNTLKLENKIRHLHRCITGIRNNHIHQVSSTLVKTKPAKVIMENLNISGMMKNRHLSKAIQQQSFYKFIETMRYKCKLNGIEFVLADRWFPSSKLCSNCNHKKTDLKLSDRTYVCSECGLKIDRDLNASINLSKL